MELKNSCILVVDDNPQNLDILITSLKHWGSNIRVATSGEEALERIERIQPDTILLDVMMPGIGGFETCRQLKLNDNTKNIPVIFMTALSEIENKVKAFKVGGVDYITKPFQYEEVAARVIAHLTIRNQQKQLEDQNRRLDEKNEQLRELNASKDRFFSIISHDLKGQFASLFLIGDLISSTFSSVEDEKANLLKDQKKVIDKTYRLLENLLDWALLKRGKVEYQPVHTDLHDIVTRNIGFLKGNAKLKGIGLTCLVEPGNTAYYDEKMISTILRNLLSNALKYTNKGGEVKVSAKPKSIMGEMTNEYMEISVTDNGVGITKKGKKALFQIDQKYRTTGTAKEHGTGLGLILCKELVEKNGGRIWVESEKDKGSTFKFTLPKYES